MNYNIIIIIWLCTIFMSLQQLSTPKTKMISMLDHYSVEYQVVLNNLTNGLLLYMIGVMSKRIKFLHLKTLVYVIAFFVFGLIVNLMAGEYPKELFDINIFIIISITIILMTIIKQLFKIKILAAILIIIVAIYVQTNIIKTINNKEHKKTKLKFECQNGSCNFELGHCIRANGTCFQWWKCVRNNALNTTNDTAVENVDSLNQVMQSIDYCDEQIVGQRWVPRNETERQLLEIDVLTNTLQKNPKILSNPENALDIEDAVVEFQRKLDEKLEEKKAQIRNQKARAPKSKNKQKAAKNLNDQIDVTEKIEALRKEVEEFTHHRKLLSNKKRYHKNAPPPKLLGKLPPSIQAKLHRLLRNHKFVQDILNILPVLRQQIINQQHITNITKFIVKQYPDFLQHKLLTRFWFTPLRVWHDMLDLDWRHWCPNSYLRYLDFIEWLFEPEQFNSMEFEELNFNDMLEMIEQAYRFRTILVPSVTEEDGFILQHYDAQYICLRNCILDYEPCTFTPSFEFLHPQRLKCDKIVIRGYYAPLQWIILAIIGYICIHLNTSFQILFSVFLGCSSWLHRYVQTSCHRIVETAFVEQPTRQALLDLMFISNLLFIVSRLILSYSINYKRYESFLKQTLALIFIHEGCIPLWLRFQGKHLYQEEWWYSEYAYMNPKNAILSGIVLLIGVFINDRMLTK